MKAKIIVTVLILGLFWIGLKDIKASESADMSIFKGFGSFVEGLIQDKHVPGMAIAIVKDGKVVYKECFGYRDVKNQLMVEPETVFNIGSTTKAFTATATGMLVEDKKLSFDDLVIDYLPEFRLKDDYSTSHITIRDLLSHKSGLPPHNAVWYKAPVTFDSIIDNLKYLESKYSFRESFSYNNILYAVEGYLAGKVYGSDWKTLIKDKIFTPLEMNSSSFTLEDYQKVDNKAKPYKFDDNKLSETDYINIGVVAPAGAINSNINDMSKWLLFNINKGKVNDKQLISESMITQLHTPNVVVPASVEYDEEFYKFYALGWGVTAYRGHLIVCHDGSIDGFHSHVSFMPQDNIGIVILSNASNSLPSLIANNAYDRLLGLNQIDWNARANEKAEKEKAAILKHKEEKKQIISKKTKPSHELEAYTGKYSHPAYGVVVITKDGNKLMGDYREPFILKPKQYDVFEAQDLYDPEDTSDISFFMNDEGDIIKLTMPLEAEAGMNIEFFEVIEE